MKKYIGCKLVEANPMTRGNYNHYRGWKIPVNENPSDEGYLVKYSDDYISWSPKEAFDKSYIEISQNNTVTMEMIDYMIDNSETKVITIDNKTTIVHCALPNGFTFVESSSCVDPANYREETGADICIKRMKDQLWGLFGFMLQTGKDGFK